MRRKKARWQLIRRATAPKAKEGCERPPSPIAGSDEPEEVLHPTHFRQMDFSTLTKPDFTALHCFSKSKSICADASAESRAIHAIWTPQNGGKRGGCVLSRAKLLILFRIDAIFQKKIFNTIEKQRASAQNKWTFFRTLPIFRPNHAPFREKPIFGGFPSSPPRFPTCTDMPERTRAHAHRALSEFAFLAFTLHLHPQHPDYQKG